MAKGQEIEELYISLGLNINDLKLGFDTAGKNVNAQMTSSILKKTCKITKEAQQLLRAAFIEKRMSARSYDRIKKVAQTIADLEGSDEIKGIHLAEAIQLRNEIGV
ncbi:hypothetical protein [Anaerovibrio lipolyticus]|uniref:magnesium chelatase subunit ChlI family protein n=1 Tax=Anaerovibrio lipolyticus TaxID=82374 RepID=UPI0026ED3791|nr:hypothetical protein [Anaerovibrio lipolyticus]